MSASHRVVHPRGPAVTRAVFDAALDAVIEHGTLRVSIEEIAVRAGVNKTTIYRRWGTVEEVVLAAVLAHADAVVPIPDTGTLAGDLGRLARLVRDTISTPRARALMIAARSSGGHTLRSMREQFWNVRLAAAAVIVDRAVERGECARPASSEQVIERLVAPIHFRMGELERAVDDAYLDSLVTHTVRALG
ncbi:MAG: TetR/AcrR family transcriptional regulator [Nocardioides sp.]